MKSMMWARLVGLLVALLILAYGLCRQVEGLDNPPPTSAYQPYSGDNPLILAQQNAGNIEYLKGRLDDALNLKKNPDFVTLSSAVDTLTQQVGVLYAQQQSIASSAQVTGVTGLGTTDLSA